MKILVTGAAGYVGNRLTHRLVSTGHTVHALIRSATGEEWLRHPAIRIFRGDICDRKSLAVAMRGCDQVYHTAGTVKVWDKNQDLFFEQNTGGTINVLKVAFEQGIKKLVYTSSCEVWSAGENYLLSENDPRVSSFDNDYALSKFLAEKAVAEYSCKGLFAVIVNPSRIYGPSPNRGIHGFNHFISWLFYRRVIPLPWHPEVKGNYAFIDDVVKGHIQAMEKGLGGERYILGGENISYRQLIEIFGKLDPRKKIFLRVPLPLLKAWGLLELLRGRISDHEPLITPTIVNRIHLDKMLDCRKAVQQLGYSITPFETGLQQTLQQLKTL